MRIDEGDSSDDGRFRIESIEAVPGAAHPTLAVHVDAGNIDCSLDDEGTEQDCTQTSWTRLLFVALIAGALEPVLDLQLSSFEQQGGDDEPVGYAAEADVGDDGRVTVRAVEGTPPRWMLGTHTLDQLISAAE